MKVVLASKNPHKLVEIDAILKKLDIELVLQSEPHNLEGSTLVVLLARPFSRGEGSQRQGGMPTQSLCPIL